MSSTCNLRHEFCFEELRKVAIEESLAALICKSTGALLLKQPVKIGLLNPWEGPAGIWSPSAQASAILAVAEINHTGGLLGREVQLVLGDAGSSGGCAAQAAENAIELDGVDAIVALVPSYARRAVSQAIDGRVPYIYTPQFEGNENDDGVVTIGETSDELLAPGVAWLTEKKLARRYFLVGNDYIWPVATALAAKRIIRSAAGIVVGESVIPFGIHDYEPLLGEIRKSQPDVVMSFLLGHEAIGFNRAFAKSGHAGRILRFSPAIDETILYGIGSEYTENLFVTSAYFSALRSKNNDGYLERYFDAFSSIAPPPNGFGESCYEGIHCLASLVDSAGGFRASEIRRRVGRTFQARTARGFVSNAVAGDRRPIHFAEVEGHDFRILAVQNHK